LFCSGVRFLRYSECDSASRREVSDLASVLLDDRRLPLVSVHRLANRFRSAAADAARLRSCSFATPTRCAAAVYRTRSARLRRKGALTQRGSATCCVLAIGCRTWSSARQRGGRSRPHRASPVRAGVSQPLRTDAALYGRGDAGIDTVVRAIPPSVRRVADRPVTTPESVDFSRGSRLEARACRRASRRNRPPARGLVASR